MKALVFLFFSCFIMAAHGQAAVGTFVSVDNQNDAATQAAAAFAVEELSKITGEKLHLVKIVSADKQLVAGFNYRIELIVAGPDNKETSYKATVYEPLGNQPKSLTQHEPIHKSTGPGKGLLGGFKDLSSDDEGVQDAAKYAVDQINSKSNSLLKYQLKEVVSARSRLANGVVYDLTLKLTRGKAEETMQAEVHKAVEGKLSMASPNSSRKE